MDRSQLTLAAAMTALTHYQDAISNNLANVTSTAFKRRAGALRPFESALSSAAAKSSATDVAPPQYAEAADFGQGDIVQTGDPLTFGLQGKGFLRVRAPGKEAMRFTRVGELAVGTDGTLMTRSGYEVLGREGTKIQLTSSRIRISRTGSILDEATGNQVGNLGIFKFAKPGALRPVGEGMYAPTSGSGQAVLDRFTVVEQSATERSNVNSIQELVSMITVQRHYGALSRAIRVLESTNEQLINLGRN